MDFQCLPSNHQTTTIVVAVLVVYIQGVAAAILVRAPAAKAAVSATMVVAQATISQIV